MTLSDDHASLDDRPSLGTFVVFFSHFPQLFLHRKQLAQLEDMVILVRGKLSNSARTTVGALTVIDVHARDVMIKLAYEKVAEK